MEKVKAKKNIDYVTIGLVLVLVIGVSLLLYPTLADLWNSFHQSRVISTYSEKLSMMSTEDYDALIEEAEEYNREWVEGHTGSMYLDESDWERYNNVLDPTGTGAMGFIEIIEIGVELPVYHGTDDAVLQVGVGHLEWSALPVGGTGTHCVLSGHRGLPSARLFTDLNQLVEGDVFVLHILDEVLTYEVDQILIVLPEDTEALLPQPGRDLCTLVTCTPYGVNSHRMFVRGHRIANLDGAVGNVHIQANATQIRNIVVAAVMALPVLVLLFLGVMLFGRKREEEE